jgi:phosphotransferase system enzyme I (PtsI)
MIEIPAAALAVGLFLRRLDFSVDRHQRPDPVHAGHRPFRRAGRRSLYDPLHPAVLMLIAHTLASAEKVGIPVSVCGEMAGDPKLTRLLLGMGLRSSRCTRRRSSRSSRSIMQSDMLRTGADRSPYVAPRGTGEDSRATGEAQRLYLN